MSNVTKRFERTVMTFVKNYEINGKINKKSKERILEQSTSWNKKVILDDMIRRIDEYKQYEDFNSVISDFPYKPYLEKLMQPEFS